jgi:twitching motility two-component system response regulator PilH
LARRILLADDSVTAQNMGRRILTDAGYEVLTVNNGSAALKKIAENKPDLIVLDVYMPGYGGLEVCQRIKESSETRLIPVLLTVGKLEPFKQEEARRVGADAFIIKPFEATELLTVLTRLEDKIVAQPQQKTGRFAKALAAVEQSDRFGDKETGWKNRLTIPRPGAKPTGEEEAPEAVASAPAGLQPGADLPSELQASQPADADKPVEPSRDFERPIPAGLPADITPEEIAAITAAAAAFGGKPETADGSPQTVVADSVVCHETTPVEVSSSGVAASEFSPEVVPSEVAHIQASEPEAPAATLNTAPEVAPQAQLEVPAEVQLVPAEAVAVSEPAKAEDVSTAPAIEAASETTTSEAQISEAEKPAGNDAEVMAAIASLAPSNGHATESIQPAAQGSNGAGQEVAAPVPAFAVLAAAAAAATGPRWIAEAVAVGAEELKLALDQEMELAHAVARSTGLASATAVESRSSTEVVAVVESVAAATATAESFSSPMAAETIAAESPLAETAIAESSIVEPSNPESPIVESPIVESPIIESSLSETSTIEASAAAALIIESSPLVEPLPVQEAEPAPVIATATAREEAAFAAAASAGAASEYASPADAASLTTTAPELPQTRPSAPADAEPQREAELAAAWKNWKQIRESLVESTPASPVAEPAAVEASSPAQEEAVSSTQSAPVEAVAEVEATAADAPEESTAIASIVDTMLAELRPKLVAEIAKKMSSEKDRKEKDKDKDRDRDRDRKKKK